MSNSYSKYKETSQKKNIRKKPPVPSRKSDTFREPQGQYSGAQNKPPKSQGEIGRKKRQSERLKKKRRIVAQEKKRRAIARKEQWVDFVQKAVQLVKKTGVLVILLVILGEILLSLHMKTKLDSLQFDINEINIRLEKEKNIIKELNTEKEAAYKSETIENIARYRMGMVYPTKEQTIYINLD